MTNDSSNDLDGIGLDALPESTALPEPVTELPMAELRAMWARKDEISAALVVEFGYSPALCLTRLAPRRGEIYIEEGEMVLLVLELDEHGQRQPYEKAPGEWDLRHQEVRVPVPPERLAQYRADLDAV